MKTLTKLVLKSYLGPFLLTFFIALFILLMQFVWKYIDDFVGKGLEWVVIGELLVYTAVTLVPMALPLSILLSSIMTFGNLGEKYELTALKSAGISLQRIMRPLIVLSFAISVGAFLFSNYILPIANLKMGSLLYDIREQKPAFDIQEGIFYNGIENYTFKIQKKDKDGQTMHNIMVYDHRTRNGANDLIIAKQGKMNLSADKKSLLVTLSDGTKYEDVQKKAGEANNKGYYPFMRTNFKSLEMEIDMSEFSMTRSKEELFKDNYQMLNIKQLQSEFDSNNVRLSRIKAEIPKQIQKNIFLDGRKNNLVDTSNQKKIDLSKPLLSQFEKHDQISIVDNALDIARSNFSYIESSAVMINNITTENNRYLIEWHKKFALSFACFLLFFIGAPLGSIIRKGGLGMPVVVSVIFFLLFHVLSISGEKMAKEDALLPFEGIWLASAILMPIGIFLTIKATSDSVLFDGSSYVRFFKKLVLKRENTAL